MARNVGTSTYRFFVGRQRYPSALADLLYEGNRDERDTWSTPDLGTAGNAGSPKQETTPAW
jgi:hypothetical protein